MRHLYLLVLASGILLLSRPAFATFPNQHESCCLTFLRGDAVDPKQCSGYELDEERCRPVAAGFLNYVKKTVEAENSERMKSEIQRQVSPTPSQSALATQRPPKAYIKWVKATIVILGVGLGIALIAGLFIFVLRLLRKRRNSEIKIYAEKTELPAAKMMQLYINLVVAALGALPALLYLVKDMSSGTFFLVVVIISFPAGVVDIITQLYLIRVRRLHLPSKTEKLVRFGTALSLFVIVLANLFPNGELFRVGKL